MSLHLIIDGYNLIRRSPSLSILDRQDLERGREELIRRLALYKRTRSFPITVVFDGWNQANLSGSRTTQRGIRVVFSRRGQKADEVIIQMAKEMGERAMVVTSDTQIQLEAKHHDAAVIPSQEFEQRMEMTSHMNQKGTDSDDVGEQTETRGTRKKGPSRRLRKNARKTQRRIKKL